MPILPTQFFSLKGSKVASRISLRTLIYLPRSTLLKITDQRLQCRTHVCPRTLMITNGARSGTKNSRLPNLSASTASVAKRSKKISQVMTKTYLTAQYRYWLRTGRCMMCRPKLWVTSSTAERIQ